MAVAGIVDALESCGARGNLSEGQEGHVRVVGKSVRGEDISREFTRSSR